MFTDLIRETSWGSPNFPIDFSYGVTFKSSWVLNVVKFKVLLTFLSVKHKESFQHLSSLPLLQEKYFLKGVTSDPKSQILTHVHFDF